MLINSPITPDSQGRRTPVQKRSQQTVDRILDSAAHIVIQSGYADLTTNDVAGHAGVSIGSLYQYFPNKGAILLALTQRHLTDVNTRLTAQYAAWDQDQPTVEQLIHDLVDVLIDLNSSDLARVLYSSAARSGANAAQTNGVVSGLVAQVAHRLVATGEAELMAKMIVVSAVSNVHEVVIQATSTAELTAVSKALVSFLIGAVSQK